MTPFANFVQLDMSKIDTSPETRFPRLPLLKACFGFGFGFGFVGLRRWPENFGWGRMGLVSRRRQPSNDPCTPPIDRNRAEKNFSIRA